MSRIETTLMSLFLVASLYAGYEVLKACSTVQASVYQIVINK